MLICITLLSRIIRFQMQFNSFMTDVPITEISPLICFSNQWTGFDMIGTSVMKELTYFLTQLQLYQNVTKELFLYSVYILLKHSNLIPILKLQRNFVQHNATPYNSMTRFVVTSGSGIQSSLSFSIIWFRKASTCLELAVIGQDGNTRRYLSFKGK